MGLVPIAAQTISVSNFYLDETDLTASRNPVYDQNGDKCALIRVQTTQKGFLFDVGSAGVQEVDENHVGEIWVYVPYGVRHISIRHQQLGSLSKYEFPVAIQKTRSYILELSSSTIRTIVEEQITSQYLVFQVEPNDAMVKLDNEFLDVVNGMAMKLVSFGNHEYTIESADYHTFHGTVNVHDSNDKVMVNVSLKPKCGWLDVSLGAQIDEAKVYIDNRLFGETPIELGRIPSGSHQIKIVHKLYMTYEGTINVEDGDTLRFSPNLQASFVNAQISADTKDEIWINGENVGRGEWTGRLASGVYVFETRRPNYETKKVQREIQGTGQNLSLKLDSPSPIYGTINVGVSPALSDIYLDGNLVGKTPMLIRDVLQGEHNIEITAPDYSRMNRTVIVKRNEVSNVEGTLSHIDLDIEKAKSYYKEGQFSKCFEILTHNEKNLDPYATYLLGCLYYEGKGGAPKNLSKVIACYTQAAEANLREAQSALASMYYLGEGVKEDVSKAIELYKKAADAGNGKACFNIALIYQNNMRNEDKAQYYFKRAVECGIVEAKQYINGDYEKKTQLTNRAKQGDLDAMFELGGLYYNKQKYNDAFSLYKKAAEKGHPGAQNSLASMYYLGEGVSENITPALLWYNKAANQGYGSACYTLGLIYLNGSGVGKNVKKAYSYFKRADQLGVKEAKNKLIACEEILKF